MNTQPTAYSYIRFSSLSQSEGRSQSRQSEACAKFCTANGLTLAQGEDYTFLDAGKSGYKAEHLDVNGQLRRFLSLVENGTIAPGSFLIVESLDRLSREHVKIALPQFMDLLNKGINIVTLLDGKTYTSDYTQLDLILSILIMTRAHEESDVKSKRVGDAWRTKKEKARLENAPIGNNAPLWLTYTDGAYLIDTGRAAIIRRIFSLAIDGYGKISIVKTLNSELIKSFKPPTATRTIQAWGTSSIQKILSNRALLGEYQPHIGRGKDRKPIGAPIPGYYPVVISEATFYQAQQATASRRITGATKQTERFNVWQGVARCLQCLSALHLVNKGAAPKGGTYLHCANSRKGLCKAKVIRLDQSELVFKQILTKVDSLSLVQDSSASISKQITEIEGRLSEQSGKLEQYEVSLLECPSTLLARLAQECERTIDSLSTEKKSLLMDLASETITDKEHFFSKLDLITYEGRYRANALLKRLKISVAIERNNGVTDYIISKEGKTILGIIQYRSGKIESVAFTADLLEKVKIQDFDGSINSSIDMLITESVTELLLNGEWWDDATLDEKIKEMLIRNDLVIAADSEEFQSIKDVLNKIQAQATTKLVASVDELERRIVEGKL